jgi:hypothetical protein
MRGVASWIAALSFGLASAGVAVAQTPKAAGDRWQVTEQSMTDLLQQGFRLVSVVAPSPQLRIFFLSNGGILAKCSEEQTLAKPPPVPLNFNPRDYTPELETKIECARLMKSR